MVLGADTTTRPTAVNIYVCTINVNTGAVGVCQVMLCRVCGFRVRGMEVLQNLTEVPAKGTEVLQNSQKFRVLYGSLTKLTEVPGGYMNVVLVPVLAPRYSTKCRVPGTYRNYRSFL